jgi:hypothetical protein
MPNATEVEVGPITGSTLTGTEDEALLQALRNLWPILSPEGRRTATDIATTLT